MMSNDILKLKLKRIDPVKYATVASLLTVLMMLIIFVPFILIVSLAGIGAGSFGEGAAIFGGSVFVIVLLPIIYGVMVFIITLIATSLLNFVLKKTGGIDIDFEKTGFQISQIGKNSPEH